MMMTRSVGTPETTEVLILLPTAKNHRPSTLCLSTTCDATASPSTIKNEYGTGPTQPAPTTL